MKLFTWTTIVMLLAFATVWAAAPQTMSYQGVLRVSPTELAPDGNYNIWFRIYDVDDGGTALWEEQQMVPVANGRFNVILGSGTPIDLAFDEQYWLGITVGLEDEMDPRIMLAGSPYTLEPRVMEITTGAGLAGGPINPANPTGEISIDTGGVETAMLASDAVTSSKIANGTIRDYDIADEPGLAHDHGALNTVVDLTDTGQSFASATIDAPTSGYVFVIATGKVFIEHQNGTWDNLIFKVSTTAGDVSTPAVATAVFRVPDTWPTDTTNIVLPMAIQHVFSVGSGSTTFHLNGYDSRPTNDDGILLPAITAIFIPTAYGATSLTEVPGVGGPDMSLGE